MSGGFKGKISAGLKACTTCQLCKLGGYATNHVLGRGWLPCDVLLVGEGPGSSEDTLGEAFIGPAGKLLDKAVGTYVDFLTISYTNLVACRPCDGIGFPNRPPSTAEMDSCDMRLRLTVLESKAKAFVLLGRTAANRQETHKFIDYDRPILCLPHPAALLRRGGESSSDWPFYRERMQAFLSKVVR